MTTINRSDLKTIRSGKPFLIAEFPSQLVEGKTVAVVGKVRVMNKLGLMIRISFMDIDLDQQKIDGNIPNGQGCSKSQCSIFSACYVQSFPMHMWALSRAMEAYKTGSLSKVSLDSFMAFVATSGLPVRIGEYGDPSSVPFEFLESIASVSCGWTGYSHGWKSCDQRLRYICMASVENEADYRLAKSKGWNVFWVNGSPDKNERLMTCPNVTSAKLDCADCRLCSGSQRKFDIVIPAHGSKAREVGIQA